MLTTPASQIESWLPELPLHTILTLISELSPQVATKGSSADTAIALAAIREAEVHGIDPSPTRVHLFEWSTLALGWYESVLWGFIYQSEAAVAKGTAGVWNGTRVRLFRVQDAAAPSPSLLAPRGAVDAVGSTLVNRIGSLSLRGGGGGASSSASGGAGGGGGGAAGPAAGAGAGGGFGAGGASSASGNSGPTVRDV